ncbi:cell wall protein [Streptomyces sp. NPDC004065]|uniref:cell wall protein n=1 Tax=Streptomyces sp. NPDC004065 TaxID=3364689 RepID=UPI0038500251
MLTATAAGTLLGALWFVPSANATVDAPARAAGSAQRTAEVTEQGRAATTAERAGGVREQGPDAREGDPRETAGQGAAGQDSAVQDAAGGARAAGGSGTELADTGSVDTTPYVVGGTLFLGLGAGFVVYSVRRERLGF